MHKMDWLSTMFGICSQKQGDVHSCIIHMKQRGHRYPILQVSDKDYNELRFETQCFWFAHQKLQRQPWWSMSKPTLFIKGAHQQNRKTQSPVSLSTFLKRTEHLWLLPLTDPHLFIISCNVGSTPPSLRARLTSRPWLLRIGLLEPA